MPFEAFEKAQALRAADKHDEALAVLERCLQKNPDHPEVHYHIASTHDSAGNESRAVPHYEAALELGLQDGRRDAFLGLGSTYRCLGDYIRSIDVFDRALAEFPADRALVAFRALTLYNLGRGREAMGDIFALLLDTTDDADLQAYQRALRLYAENPDKTWS